MYILFHILFHGGLSQGIEYSSLCSTVGPYCLSVLYIVAGICSPQTPNPSLFTLTPWQPPVCCLWPRFCFCFLGRFICHILGFTCKWHPMEFGEDTCWFVVPPVGGSPGPQGPRDTWEVHGLREDGTSQTLLDKKQSFILFHWLLFWFIYRSTYSRLINALAVQ